MKQSVFLLLCIIFSVIMQSCNDDEVLQTSEPTTIRSRAIVDYSNESTTNPDLIENWENVTEIELNTPGIKTVTAPWCDGTTSNLPADFRMDIHKADGWDMLFHTFKRKGLDEKQNYMCFYNKFTGILKVFYYSEAETPGGTITEWHLSQDTGATLKMFDSPDFFSKADDKPVDNLERTLKFTNAVTNDVSGLTRGWNGFQYQISRYSNESTDCMIQISATDAILTSYEFLGKSENLTTGTITSVTSSDPEIAAGTVKSNGTLARSGDVAKRLLANADKLKGITNLNNKLTDLLTPIVSNPYFSAVAAGLKYMFGRSTVTTLYTTSEVYLESKGTITTSGTGQTTTPSTVSSIPFNLKSVLNGSTGNDKLVTPKNKVGYEQLGVWTLKKNPKVYYQRIGSVWPERLIKNGTAQWTSLYPITEDILIGNDSDAEIQSDQWGNENHVGVEGQISLPSFWHGGVDVEFNPGIKQYLKSYKVNISFFNCDKANGVKYESDFEDVYAPYSLESIYSDNETTIDSIPSFGKFTYQTVFPPEMLNMDDTQNFYFDWGTILRGKLISFVSVDMTFNYEGKEFRVYETRAYPVDYGYDPGFTSSYYHNPPHDVVINFYNPLRYDLEKYYGGDPSRVP